MPRAKIAPAGLALLAFATLPLVMTASRAWARDHSYGFETGGDRVSWAYVSGDNTSLSDLDAIESLDRLKSDYGGEFLYIREADDRYVVRDRALLARARDAMGEMQEAGREIGEMARARAQSALSATRDARERARWGRRIARLQRRTERLTEDGMDTRELKRALDRLQSVDLERQLSVLSVNSGSRHESDHDSARWNEASRRIQEATRRVNRVIREILRDAKARGFAEPVE